MMEPLLDSPFGLMVENSVFSVNELCQNYIIMPCEGGNQVLLPMRVSIVYLSHSGLHSELTQIEMSEIIINF